MTASREVGAPPLTPIELHDVAMLDGAADAIAAGKKNRATAGPRVQTASDSERRWAEYKRIGDTPPEARCDDEQQFFASSNRPLPSKCASSPRLPHEKTDRTKHA